MTPDSGSFDPADPTSCPGAPFWNGFLAGRQGRLSSVQHPELEEQRGRGGIRGLLYDLCEVLSTKRTGKRRGSKTSAGKGLGPLCSLKAKGGRGMAGVLICLQKVLRPCGLGISRVQKLGTGTPQCRGIQHCCEAGKEVWGLGFQANASGALQPGETTGPSRTP